MINLEPALKKGEKEFERLYKKAERLINEKIKKLPADKNLNLYAGETEKITVAFEEHCPAITTKELVLKLLVLRLNVDYKFSFRQITNGFIVYLNKYNIPEEQQ